MSTKVKICGITRLVDAQAAISAGADAIGLNFVPKSARYIDLAQAAEIAEAVAGKILRVAVFADADPAVIADTLTRVPVDLLQFHGAESGQACRQFNRPYVKAVPMKPNIDFQSLQTQYLDACGLLLDTYDPQQAGGTGRTFDWSRWPKSVDLPLILAGGLTLDNVADAVAQLQPAWVDLSGGVEQEGRKGVKDANKISRFVAAAKMESQ